jgi:hypothetical protein
VTVVNSSGNNVRAKGLSMACFTHWLMNALISFIFPLITARSGGYPFVFFAAMMVLQFFVVLLNLSGNQGPHAGGDAEDNGGGLSRDLRQYKQPVNQPCSVTSRITQPCFVQHFGHLTKLQPKDPLSKLLGHRRPLR